jgi:1,4-dihydroxy-2-naphthoate octaprenyltransferase
MGASNEMTSFLQKLMKLARLRFLISGPLGFLCGAALSGVNNVQLGPSFIALLVIALCHVNSHFVNDYFDYESDKQNQTRSEQWTGGSRVLADGQLPQIVGLAAGLVASFATIVISLIFLPNWKSFAVVMVMLLATWAYSAPPFSLAHRGLGEATVTVVLCVLVPLTASAVLGGTVTISMALTLAVIGIITMARMLVMNLADHKSDAITGKRSLVVQLGLPASVSLYIGGTVFAYFLAAVFCLSGFISSQVGVILLLFAAPRALAPLRGVLRFGRTGVFDRSLPSFAVRANASAFIACGVGATMAQFGVPAACALPVVLYVHATSQQ